VSSTSRGPVPTGNIVISALHAPNRAQLQRGTRCKACETTCENEHGKLCCYTRPRPTDVCHHLVPTWAETRQPQCGCSLPFYWLGEIGREKEFYAPHSVRPPLTACCDQRTHRPVGCPLGCYYFVEAGFAEQMAAADRVAVAVYEACRPDQANRRYGISRALRVRAQDRPEARNWGRAALSWRVKTFWSGQRPVSNLARGAGAGHGTEHRKTQRELQRPCRRT
jgi:hypothetical protein